MDAFRLAWTRKSPSSLKHCNDHLFSARNNLHLIHCQHLLPTSHLTQHHGERHNFFSLRLIHDHDSMGTLGESEKYKEALVFEDRIWAMRFRFQKLTFWCGLLSHPILSATGTTDYKYHIRTLGIPGRPRGVQCQKIDIMQRSAIGALIIRKDTASFTSGQFLFIHPRISALQHK